MGNHEQLMRLIEDALNLDADERASWLKAACHGDEALFKEAWSLIEADAIDSEQFAIRPLEPETVELAGTIIGYWRLIRELGRGGMGSVWLAERSDDVLRMTAAIKIIKPELVTPQALIRFRRERQIMADLNHPHIAVIHDAGTTDDGWPFFVMEYVDGDTIERFCDTRELSHDERIRLFLQACDAVQFAHRRGIIHRDIKPPNIMVTAHGVVKLMDFGIAHLATGEWDETGLTRTGQLIMTPEYASPEQLRGEPAGVASDLYALALVLCRLVTGKRPRQLSPDTACAIEEALVRNESLMAPILAKALDHDPKQRHDSVESLIRDLKAFLGNGAEGSHLKSMVTVRYDAMLWCAGEMCVETEKLALNLEALEKLNLWLFDRQREPGETPQLAYARALAESACLVVCAGGDGPWLDGEIRRVIEQGLGMRRVVPVLLRGAVRPERESDLPAFLRRRTWATVTHPSDPAELRRLAQAILGQRGEANSLNQTETCPFKGLDAFTEEDARFFFGRDELIQRLTGHMHQHHFLAVLGPSGSGKSSVVQAGLLPELRERDMISLLFTPASRPLVELAFALFRLHPDDPHWDPPEMIWQRLSAGDEALYFILRELRDEYACHICLVIDQFEEIFTLATDQKEISRFLNSLLYVIEQPQSPASLVLTLRSDFVGRCAAWPDLNRHVLENAIQVEPLDRDALAQSVSEPARLAGLRFEDGLVTRILDDVAGASGELPLMEHALLELWERRRGRTLTLAAYAEIGGIEGALAQRAESEYARLDESHREVLRKIFTLCLVHPGEGAEDTRRRATLDELNAVGGEAKATQSLLSRWTAARLLTASLDETRSVETVDVAHEALIRKWERIRAWMDEDREIARQLNRLRQVARAWTEEGCDEDRLLRGAPLAQMGALCEQQGEYLDALEKDFVAQGFEAQNREEQARETRRKRELRRSRLIVALMALILVAGTFFTLRLRQREKETNMLLTDSIIRNSFAAFDRGEMDLALYLNIEAGKRSSSPKEANRFHHMMTANTNLPFTMRHEGYIEGATFSQDEGRILSWSRDKSLRLWDTYTGLQLGPEMLHEDWVEGAVINCDDSRILSWSRDNSLRLWDMTTNLQVGPAMLHDDGVSGASFNKDESRILSWSHDSTLRFWDTATSLQIGAPMFHEGWVRGAVFNQDDSRILSWSQDKSLRIWDTATGIQMGLDMLHDDAVYGAIFNKDESRILSWSGDNTLRLWHTAAGHQVGPSMLHEHGVLGARFNREENRILSWSLDKTLRLWDATTGIQVGPAMLHEGWVLGAVFDQDEHRILSWGIDDSLRLWATANNLQMGHTMFHEARVFGGVFNQNENLILSWSMDKTIRLWDVASGRQVGPTMFHENTVSSAIFNGNEDRVLSWGLDKTLRLWSTTAGFKVKPAMLHEAWVNGATYDKNEKHVLSWSDDKTLRLWNTTTGLGLTMLHEGYVLGALFNKDESLILSWSEDKTLYLWDTTTGLCIKPTIVHESWIVGAMFDRDERRILSWSSDKSLRLWDITTGLQVGESMFHEDSVQGAIFNKDGSLILSWSADMTLRLWDTDTSIQVGSAMLHDGNVLGAIFNKDESRILSWSFDNTLRIWNTATSLQVGPAMFHEDKINGAVFDRDERRILSWSHDASLRLWDTTTCLQKGPTMQHEDEVVGAMFDQNGRRILSWSSDKTMRLWNTGTGMQMGPAMPHGGTVKGALFNGDESHIISWSGDKMLRLWDTATGLQVGPSMPHSVSGAMLSRDETQVLFWGNGRVGIWHLSADWDLPLELMELQIQVITQTKFDAANRTVIPIHDEESRALWERYLPAARAHYAVCRYREFNHFARTYPSLVQQADD